MSQSASAASVSPAGRASSPPLAVAPEEAARLAGVGRTTLYEALKTGALQSLKIGRRRLIRIDALEAWLDAHGC